MAEFAESPQLNVVLNTWLLLYIHNQEPSAHTLGGLPNDFLTRGAASLLILDHVICDEDGLSTEAAMPWVSTHIFNVLRAEGLLRPERLRLRYSDATLDRLRETGLIRWAEDTMAAELAKITSGAVATIDLELPASLRWLNSVMFTGINLPNALHYDYHESHFSNLSLSAQQLPMQMESAISETLTADDQAVKASRLMAALKIALPDFQLLPPITSMIGRKALYENIRDEKRMMYRYVYGDLAHPEYERFRSSGEFKRRDALIDNKIRFKQADENLEILLRVREATADIRPLAQQKIAAVVNGTLSLEAVEDELERIRFVIDYALKLETKTRDMHILAGAKALLGAGETLASLNHPVAGLNATMSFAEAFHHWRESVESREFGVEVRRQFPLAWIAGVHTREREKAEKRSRKRPNSVKRSGA